LTNQWRSESSRVGSFDYQFFGWIFLRDQAKSEEIIPAERDLHGGAWTNIHCSGCIRLAAILEVFALVARFLVGVYMLSFSPAVAESLIQMVSAKTYASIRMPFCLLTANRVLAINPARESRPRGFSRTDYQVQTFLDAGETSTHRVTWHADISSNLNE
jgi:hypothetical protein